MTLMLLSFILYNFLVRMLKCFEKNLKSFFFAHQKLKKPLKKLHTYGSWEFFFFATPTAQNSPELPFCFMISFIQSSPLRSLALIYPCCRKRGNILVIGHCCCYPSKSRVLVRILNLLVLFAIFIFNF